MNLNIAENEKAKMTETYFDESLIGLISSRKRVSNESEVASDIYIYIYILGKLFIRY